VLASVLGAAKDRGRWWTAGDRLCVKWFRWFDAKARCVVLRQEGQRIFWQGPDGRSGTGTIAELAKPVEAPPAPYALGAETVAKAEMAKPEPSKPEPAPEAAPEPAPEARRAAHPSADRLAAQFADMTAFAAKPHVVPPPPTEASSELSGAASAEPTPAAASAPKTEPSVEQASETPPAQPPVAARAKATRNPVPAKNMSMVTLASFRVAGVDEDDMLNVRSGPSEHAEPIGGLAPESRGVQIVGRCFEAWCPVRHGRVSGWVNRHYLVEERPGSTALNDAR